MCNANPCVSVKRALQEGHPEMWGWAEDEFIYQLSASRSLPAPRPRATALQVTASKLVWSWVMVVPLAHLLVCISHQAWAVCGQAWVLPTIEWTPCTSAWHVKAAQQILLDWMTKWLEEEHNSYIYIFLIVFFFNFFFLEGEYWETVYLSRAQLCSCSL